MFWKFLWGLLFLSNAVTLAAIQFFGFQPSPHQMADAAFFGAGTACLAMFRQE